MHLNNCLCGFGSAYLYMLGLYEFCDKNNISFSFDKNGVIHHYTQSFQNIWDELFETKFLVKLNNSDRKYHCNLSIPPSPNPFFNFLATTDETCCITKEWAFTLNPYISYVKFKENNYIKKYELSDDLPMNYFGIHLRGTDSHTHGSIDPLEKKINQIQKNFEESNCDKIFLMTDDKRYFEPVVHYFGKNVVYVVNTIRSDNSLPLHEAYKNNYHEYSNKALEHLQDLFFELNILSKSTKSLLGISAITQIAKIMNPKLDVIMFGDRTRDTLYWKNQTTEDTGFTLHEIK